MKHRKSRRRSRDVGELDPTLLVITVEVALRSEPGGCGVGSNGRRMLHPAVSGRARLHGAIAVVAGAYRSVPNVG